MGPGWVLIHHGSVHALPTLAMARYTQRAIVRFALSGGPETVRFSSAGTVEIVTVVIDETTRVGQRVPTAFQPKARRH